MASTLTVTSFHGRALWLAAGCLAALLAGPCPADAQSLADIAAREDARRKKIHKPSPVYTNKDVKPSDRPAPSPGSAGAETPAPAEGGDAPPASAGDDPPAEGEPPAGEEPDREQQEQQWRTRMTEARAALERNQMFAEALQSRVNALWADFTARDDPAQRSVVDAERKKALAQLDRVKAEIVTQTKAIADIEEEARRAGIPPGWLR
jgi:hypothetical protein